MIATIETTGVVKSKAGCYFFTERMGERTFLGIPITRAIYTNGAWTHEHPRFIEVGGDFVVELEPRRVPVLVDEAFVNSQLPDEDLTWEDYQEVCHLLEEEF